ncbi:hypothetical protein [Cyclobacterium marinum]|uniref:hypothetical protein n=1 Tax=Cyclobacterium marinum TaxID=104 RepID=UPI001F54FE53|nr:hypothetical protein [Cyclobacterium marinum]
MNFIKTDITETIDNLRSQLYKSLKAPIDAMWEQLYIGSSQHYLIEENETLGYCCINEAGSLTQIFLAKKLSSTDGEGNSKINCNRINKFCKFEFKRTCGI